MARHLPVVAVLTFGGNGAGEQELGAVTARFETELMGTDSFTLVERRNIDKILKEQGFQQSGACDTTDCAVQIGQLLSVQSIFTGELTKAGKLWSLQVKRTDVGSSRTQFSQILDIEGSFEEVLRSGVPEMAELASGRKKANRERNVLVAKQASLWPWVLGGGALIGGGTAVYLLTQGSSQSSTAATTGDGSWQTTVRWK